MFRMYSTLLDDLFDNAPTRGLPSSDSWIKTDEEVTSLYLELPGVKKEDVEIRAERGILNVKAKRSWPNVATFEKNYTLSRYADIDNIECKLQDGVLEIKLPKKESAKAKLITIN